MAIDSSRALARSNSCPTWSTVSLLLPGRPVRSYARSLAVRPTDLAHGTRDTESRAHEGVTVRPTRLMAPSPIGASSLGLLPRGKVPQSISIRIEGRQRLKILLNLKVDGCAKTSQSLIANSHFLSTIQRLLKQPRGAQFYI